MLFRKQNNITKGQFGTDEGAQLHSSIVYALRTGYRLIDTAQYYGVESIVGSAIRESGISREEITVVTKFWGEWHHDPATALKRSLQDMGLEYVDILFMHWPCALSADGKQVLGIDESPTFVETWQKMEHLVGEQCKAIGVSNFTQKTLAELLQRCKVVPVVNQVELHALNPGLELVPWCEARGIKVMSWRYRPLLFLDILISLIQISCYLLTRSLVVQFTVLWVEMLNTHLWLQKSYRIQYLQLLRLIITAQSGLYRCLGLYSAVSLLSRRAARQVESIQTFASSHLLRLKWKKSLMRMSKLESYGSQIISLLCSGNSEVKRR